MQNQTLSPTTPAAQSPSSNPVTSTHRLAAVSASAALQRASAAGSSISCGSALIDGLLAVGADARGGLPRGKVVDLHGPPGVGKTTLGLTVAANAISAGGSVVWIDCSAPVSVSRLHQIFASPRSGSGLGPELGTDDSKTSPHRHHQRKVASATVTTENFHHYNTPTLAHLLALLLRQSSASVTPGALPTTTFPPPNTQLLVLDSLSTLLALAFPYPADLPSSSSSSNATAAAKRQAASARRWAIQRDIAAALGRLAAVRYVAVLVTQQLATRIDRNVVGVRQRAVLKATLGTKSWVEGGVWARVLMCRHWGSSLLRERASEWAKKKDSDNKYDDTRSITRFALLVKLGSTEFEGFGRVVPFGIDEGGIIDVEHSHLLNHQKGGSTQSRTIQSRSLNPHSLDKDNPLRLPDRQQPGSRSGFGSNALVPAKRHAAEIADSESEGEDGEASVTAAAAAAAPPGTSDGVELEEDDEFGMTKEEEALLELEMIEAQTSKELESKSS